MFVKDGPGVGTYNLSKESNIKTAFGKFDKTPKDIDPKVWSPNRTTCLWITYSIYTYYEDYFLLNFDLFI